MEVIRRHLAAGVIGARAETRLGTGPEAGPWVEVGTEFPRTNPQIASGRQLVPISVHHRHPCTSRPTSCSAPPRPESRRGLKRFTAFRTTPNSLCSTSFVRAPSSLVSRRPQSFTSAILSHRMAFSFSLSGQRMPRSSSSVVYRSSFMGTVGSLV